MCPFDAVDIHALLEHVPQWGEIAQTANGFTHQRNGVIDLFFRGETPQGETDRAVR
ncbi:hypothetical protein D3C79_750060 [compost metagenome]